MYHKNFKPRYSRGNNRPQNRRKIKSFDPTYTITNGHVDPVEKITEQKIRHKFSDFAVSDQLKRNIAYRGFTTPTPIQDQAIPQILGGKDLVGIANTGTGKTAAFLIPLIDKVLNKPKTRVLILAPTRELVVQIEKDLTKLSHNLKIYSVILIGGVSIHGQIKRLAANPNFVIATPGRLLDLENQKKINLHSFDTIILDEVDRMLDMGFIGDVEKIISKLPNERQSLFFSATLEENIKNIMTKFTKNPVTLKVQSQKTKLNIHEDIVKINGQSKTHVLENILDQNEVSKALVFMRTKRSADNLNRILSKSGFQTAVLHGNRTQNQRQRSLNEFSRGKVNVLIATDVASRGIDVRGISHVINYDLPESHEVYIHRIGRTGRANKKGVALTFIA